jgi:phosphatidylserine/phosphatidylglycerophosphate/cardiolipin synthase-like enzyme
MFYWKGERGDYLAGQLLDLAREGCRVSVIYGAPSIKLASRLREAARRRLITLFDSRWDINGDGYVDTRTHAKYVLVRGRYGQDKRAWRVLTGTQNWVAGSLGLSDENTLNIDSRSAYGHYVANWNRIRRHSRQLPYAW